ncbi:hypothetical protein DFJ58DRAFT_740000 [Suillus subalutaceus]|uniref:uncharacterized protein n=1 Tax=Suillus subalutaceus TaxID=48586 RepID=UPI001B884704|nr:uncharacterized protein DFJ58DRAFT_740000 [Suillus subalutaceus]KAG1814167.1 hypothetical protein DFJ58DRAFT_740000 [Suillus subalutaceus]
MLGTTDNYNTEYTERLHIDYAKDAYRATNHKDEFVQMMRWLERKEKILRHDKYVNWRLASDDKSEPHHSCPPNMTFHRLQTMTKHPTAKAVSIDKLIEDYSATYFCEALARYITWLGHADDPIPLHSQALDVLAHNIHFPFRTLPVFHKITWLSVDARGHGDATVTLDSVHARPQRRLDAGLLPRHSDTVLVNLGANTEVISAGIEAFRVAQFRFLTTWLMWNGLRHFHWLLIDTTDFTRSHDPCMVVQKWHIVPLLNIVRSVHLIPNFGAVVP